MTHTRLSGERRTQPWPKWRAYFGVGIGGIWRMGDSCQLRNYYVHNTYGSLHWRWVVVCTSSSSLCVYIKEFFKYANWQTNAGEDDGNGNNLQLPGLKLKPILPPKPKPNQQRNEIQTARSVDGFNREREASKSCKPC